MAKIEVYEVKYRCNSCGYFKHHPVKTDKPPINIACLCGRKMRLQADTKQVRK